jgi:hypothetical protein
LIQADENALSEKNCGAIKKGIHIKNFLRSVSTGEEECDSLDALNEFFNIFYKTQNESTTMKRLVTICLAIFLLSMRALANDVQVSGVTLTGDTPNGRLHLRTCSSISRGKILGAMSAHRLQLQTGTRFGSSSSSKMNRASIAMPRFQPIPCITMGKALRLRLHLTEKGSSFIVQHRVQVT